MIITLIQQATTPAGSAGSELISTLLMFGVIGIIFYFLLIRPQSQRMKKHRSMLDAIGRGDEVVTNGGLIGKVKKVTDEDVTITIGTNMDVKVVRTMIADVRNRKSAAND